MIPDELLSKLMKRTLVRGGDYSDIFIEQKRSTAIQLEDNKIEKVISGSIAGIGIRLIKNGKTAYAFSNDFSEGVLMDIADTVSKALSSNGDKKDILIDMKKVRPQTSFLISMPPDSVPTPQKISLVKSANETAIKYDSRIKQASVIYRDSVQKVSIFTSDGIMAQDERTYTVGIVQAVAIEGDIIQTGYEPIGGLIGFEIFNGDSINSIALAAANRAVKMLGAKRAPGGKMPVVISSDAGGTMIHEAIGHGLEADLAQHGLSVYSKRIGQQVASPLITVIDDGTMPNKRGSFSFDDEATPSGRNVLVKDGILIGYMYDRLSAMIDGAKLTGNGRRESYEHKPVPRMTNTFIAPGESSADEIIKSVDKGILVKKMGGGQVNTVTGDFVFEVQEGYLIENGAEGELVRGATLIGNGPQVLQSIDMIATDLGFSIGTCGKDGQGVPVSDAMPTLRIPDIVVGGEVA
jgi:TldD protein